MKKSMTILMAILFASGVLFAQDEMPGKVGAFDARELLVEITGTPFAGSSLLNFGSMRLRYSVTDAIVPRIGINMSLSNDQSTPDKVTDLSEYTVMPGVEYHLRIDNPFRSYVALDAIFGQRFASAKSTTGVSVDGSTQIPSGNNYSFSDGSRGHMKYGVAVGLGGEYHLSSRFYVGVEVGLQVVREAKDEVNVDGELYQESTTRSYGSINTSNTFRIGFKLL